MPKELRFKVVLYCESCGGEEMQYVEHRQVPSEPESEGEVTYKCVRCNHAIVVNWLMYVS
jgi:hypothetical protein